MCFFLISLLLCWFLVTNVVLYHETSSTLAWFPISNLIFWRHEAMNGQADCSRARSLLERRSSPHPFFIIDSTVWSSAKRSCYSLMFAIHLHHALCHDKIHQEVRGRSRKDTITSHCRAANKTHSLLPYCKSSLLDRSRDECRRSRSEIKDQELRTSCLVRQFVLKL